MKRRFILQLAADRGISASDEVLDDILRDPGLRERVGLCAYAADLLERIEGRAIGAASLALWRTFAWTREGSPRKNFVLTTDAIMFAQDVLCERLRSLEFAGRVIRLPNQARTLRQSYNMDPVTEIRLMWNEWKARPFPSEYGDKDVAGICVTSLDTFAAGCIDAFISNNGRLDKRRTTVLEQCKTDLEAVVSGLDGTSKNYFNDLLILAKRVLQLSGQ